MYQYDQKSIGFSNFSIFLNIFASYISWCKNLYWKTRQKQNLVQCIYFHHTYS